MNPTVSPKYKFVSRAVLLSGEGESCQRSGQSRKSVVHRENLLALMCDSGMGIWSGVK